MITNTIMSPLNTKYYHFMIIIISKLLVAAAAAVVVRGDDVQTCARWPKAMSHRGSGRCLSTCAYSKGECPVSTLAVSDVETLGGLKGEEY